MTAENPQTSRTSKELMLHAYNNATVIPAFNIPYLPLLRPVAQAMVDSNVFGFIELAMVEWVLFGIESQRELYEEYRRYYREPWMRLHQDHVPVIDETNTRIDYLSILREAVDLGFDSIMVDGSRLPLEENIAAAQEVVAVAAPRDVAVEAELGAVLGHEAGPRPPYEELFASGKGFTDIDEARRFVEQTGIDWLSVACGNIHGAIHGAAKDLEKVQARLNIEHLQKLKDALDLPLVLHGGSGIKKESILAGIKAGISKINIGTEVRQVYENTLKDTDSVEKAADAVYDKVIDLLQNTLQLKNSRDILNPA